VTDPEPLGQRTPRAPRSVHKAYILRRWITNSKSVLRSMCRGEPPGGLGDALRRTVPRLSTYGVSTTTSSAPHDVFEAVLAIIVRCGRDPISVHRSRKLWPIPRIQRLLRLSSECCGVASDCGMSHQPSCTTRCRRIGFENPTLSHGGSTGAVRSFWDSNSQKHKVAHRGDSSVHDSQVCGLDVPRD
jgi:hypothetical protein